MKHMEHFSHHDTYQEQVGFFKQFLNLPKYFAAAKLTANAGGSICSDSCSNTSSWNSSPCCYNSHDEEAGMLHNIPYISKMLT